MKKTLLVAAVAALALSSCSTVSHTADTEGVDTRLYNRSTADLTVQAARASFTLTPTKAQQRAGMKSMKAAAVTKLLEANGNADVLVAPRFEIKSSRGLFGSKVNYITVSGHAANYKNFHPTTATEAEVISTLNGRKK